MDPGAPTTPSALHNTMSDLTGYHVRHNSLTARKGSGRVGEREIEWVFSQERAPKSGPETGSLVAAVWPSNWYSLAARIEPALAAGRPSGRRKPKNAACSRRESTYVASWCSALSNVVKVFPNQP